MLFIIKLVEKLVEVVFDYINNVFFIGLGLEFNDIVLCLVCYYWVVKGQLEKSVIISCKNVYYGLIVVGVSLGGMGYMYK